MLNRSLAFLTPRRGLALVGAAALVLVAASLVLTRLLDLAPCPLCIFQRMLYLVLALFALLAAAWPRVALPAAGAALLASLGGLATAAYQTWMQAFPLALSCGAPDPGPIERLVAWAGERVPWLFYAWGDCASREWEWFGLSLANWSLAAFLGFSAVLAWAAWRTLRPRAQAD